MDLYKTCPSCTWRMEIELVNGVCPQCGVNWHELQAAKQSVHLTCATGHVWDDMLNEEGVTIQVCQTCGTRR